MNNIIKALSASALMLLALASCQKEALSGSQTEGIYTFEVSADQVATKASIDGDGNAANVNRFIMEVYLAKPTGELVYLDRQVKAPTGDSPKRTTFELTLIKDQAYKVLFWADKGTDALGDLYYDTQSNLQNVSILAAGRTGNNDALDAFSKMEEITPAESRTGFSKSVQLKRPFGQVNFITTDIPAIVALAGGSGFIPTDVKVSYTSCTAFNVLTQEGTAAEAFEYTAPVYSTVDPQTAPAKYTLSMDYMLTATEDSEARSLVKLTAYSNDYELTSVEVPNYPVQRNYRTNIIGNLLTSSNEFVVEVDPMWKGENEVNVVAPGVFQFVDNVYEIHSEEGLNWLSRTCNSGNTLEGKTVKLAADLDMTGIDYVPAGFSMSAYPSYTFAGVFDGQGHTISNLSVSSHTGEYSCAGLFGTITGTVKNVKLVNVNITSDHYAGGIVGYTSWNTGASIQNCSVDGGTIKSIPHTEDNTTYVDGDKAGGIVGYITAKDHVEGCSVKNVTVTAYRDLGAIVGCAGGSGEVKVTDCVVGSNVFVVVDNSHNYQNFTTNEAHKAGNFVGNSYPTLDATGSTGEAQIIYPAQNAVATVNGTSYSTLQEAVSAATDGSTLMILEPQSLTSANLQFGEGKAVTVVGSGENSVLDASERGSYVSCSGNITFVNMTFKFNQGTNYHYNIGLHNGGGTQVYENCKFEGQTVAWGNTTYNNCEFTSTAKYGAWVYSGTVVYNNCKISGVNRAAKVFDEGPALDVTYNNCTFSCQSTSKAAVEVDVTCNTSNLVKVTINNPILEGHFGQAEHWGTEYFNLEGGNGSNGVVTIDGITYAKVATNNAFDVAVNETSKEINVKMTGDCGITTSNFYNKLGGPETTVINIEGNGKALTINSAYRNHIVTDNNAKIVLKNVTMDSNYAVSGSTWDDYGLIFDCPTEFTNVTFNRQLVLSQPFKHVLNNVTINQTSATGDMYALWIEAGADVTFNGGVINAINSGSGSNRAIKIADEYMPTPCQLTKLNVSGVTFKSQKKAAVLVTSTAGADIVWGAGNDISQVAADQTNAVWNDSARTAAWDLVTVNGCTKYQEL